MTSAYEDLLRIVDGDTSRDQRIVAMRGFAERLNWTPSYEFQASFGVSGAFDHLVVEHGLDNSAIISFLQAPYRAADLTPSHLRDLLSISYNNLVDWHFFVSQTDIRRINNLAESSRDPEADCKFQIEPSGLSQHLAASDIGRLRSSRRGLKPCDEALIQVIARWKRLLKADIRNVSNTSLSALFNAIIFVRGCEDRHFDRPHRSQRPLIDLVVEDRGTTLNLADKLSKAMELTAVDRPLADYIDIDQLTPFRNLDKATAINLIKDFYAPSDAAYDFNFALMSKHALSRIYERYVSILQPSEDDRQLSFINALPVEQETTKTGVVYTPQFVAGFFSRYIRENTTPRKFRNLRSIDPACGSGIFLRTLLELQCNPTSPGTTATTIRDAFKGTEGIDVDPNACEAARLSLALLHLVATGRLPHDLAVRNADAIVEALAGRIERGGYGAVMTNPPFIKLDHLPAASREIYREFLGSNFSGRLDAYIPFVKLCLEAAEPGGFVCMVLPQVFLTANNSAELRNTITREFDVRCLVDLSSVPVFEGVGAYSVLLIVQRRLADNGTQTVRAQIAQATDFVGAALQACLDARTVDNEYYRVFTVPQTYFHKDQWVILTPNHIIIDDRLSKLPRLGDVATVVQGFITGADDVFIRPNDLIPKRERAIYMDYLPDRDIGRYATPTTTSSSVFYPYEGDRLITEERLKERYPKTFDYLKSHRRKLSARKRSSSTPWWKPERPREPARMKRPKVVCPHLMLTPRFAIDLEGRYAVSHSPFIIAKETADEVTILKFLVATLNSTVCTWFMRAYAPRFARGYSRVETNLLNEIPVPNLSDVSTRDLNRIISAVDKMATGKAPEQLDHEVDEIITELYGFTSHERKELFGL